MDEIVAFAELEDFIHAPVRTYSSGMQVRLAFSIASHVRADILILDEVFAVGDESFQRKCLGRMFDFRRQGGTILFVSHSADAVQRICDRVVLLEAGEMHADGPAGEVLTDYHRLLADRSSRTGAVTERPGRSGAPRGDLEWGDKEAEVTDVRLLDGYGASRTSFQQGEVLVLEVDFVRHDPETEGLNVGFAVSSVDGALCLGSNTIREGIRIPAEMADGTVRITLPALQLNSGRFTLTIALGPEDEGPVYHSLERWLSFDVYPTLPRVGLFTMETIVEVSERRGGRGHRDLGVTSPRGARAAHGRCQHLNEHPCSGDDVGPPTDVSAKGSGRMLTATRGRLAPARRRRGALGSRRRRPIAGCADGVPPAPVRVGQVRALATDRSGRPRRMSRLRNQPRPHSSPGDRPPRLSHPRTP